MSNWPYKCHKLLVYLFWVYLLFFPCWFRYCILNSVLYYLHVIAIFSFSYLWPLLLHTCLTSNFHTCLHLLVVVIRYYSNKLHMFSSPASCDCKFVPFAALSAFYFYNLLAAIVASSLHVCIFYPYSPLLVTVSLLPQCWTK